MGVRRGFKKIALFMGLVTSSFASADVEEFGVLTTHKEGTLYSTRLESDLYLIVEKLDYLGSVFWEEFALWQTTYVSRTDIPGVSCASGIAAEPFRQALLDTRVPCKFVAYASYTLDLDHTLENWAPQTSACYANIEMSVCVLTDNGPFKPIPWVTHMGIQRSAFAAMAGKPRHPHVSMKVHSFAAHVMGTLFADKAYMITNPMPVMRDLFAKSMSKDSLWVGSQVISLGQAPDPEGSPLANCPDAELFTPDIAFRLRLPGGGEYTLTESDKRSNSPGWFFSAQPLRPQPYVGIDYATISLEALADLYFKKS